MRFVHIADIHVGMGFSTASFGVEKGKERRREIKETLLGVVAYCQRSKVDLLLIAGDLFEEAYVSISELKDINGAFSQLTQTQVLMSAGNHDPIADKNSLYKMIKWCQQVYIFDTKMERLTIEALKTEVWSFSWDKKHLPPLTMTKPLPYREGWTKLMMLHGDVYQVNDYHYIDKKMLKSIGVDYVALGHIHKMDFVEPWLAYPGSLEPLDFSEVGPHGFIEGEICGGQLTTSFKVFAKRAFHKLEVQVSGDMTFEAIVQTIGDVIKKHPVNDFFRISLVGDIDSQVVLDLEAIKDRYKESYYYIELKDCTQVDIDIEALEKGYQGTLVGAYISALKSKDLKDPVVADALKKGLRLLLNEQVRL